MHADFPTPPHVHSAASSPPHATATFNAQAVGLRSQFRHKQPNHGPWDDVLKHSYAAVTDCSGLWRDRVVA